MRTTCALPLDDAGSFTVDWDPDEDGEVSDVQREVPAKLFRKDVRLVFLR